MNTSTNGSEGNPQKTLLLLVAAFAFCLRIVGLYLHISHVRHSPMFADEVLLGAFLLVSVMTIFVEIIGDEKDRFLWFVKFTLALCVTIDSIYILFTAKSLTPLLGFQVSVYLLLMLSMEYLLEKMIHIAKRDGSLFRARKPK